MDLNQAQEWIKNATIYELVDQVIWEAIMSGTAHCGWTQNARNALVESTRDSVRWAINQKLKKGPENE